MPIQSTCPLCGGPAGLFSRRCPACYHAAQRDASPRTVLARIWAKVDKRGTIPSHRPRLGRCWLFTGVRDHRGYGKITLNGRAHPVYRVTWASINGPIPADLVIDHLCRNPACVRPTHLEPVTSRENQVRGESPTMTAHRLGICLRGHVMTPETAWMKGNRRSCKICHRAAAARRLQAHPPVKTGPLRGERCSSAKLTDIAVREIRRLWADGGVTMAELSRRFGVAWQTIADVVHGRTWAHVS